MPDFSETELSVKLYAGVLATVDGGDNGMISQIFCTADEVFQNDGAMPCRRYL